MVDEIGVVGRFLNRLPPQVLLDIPLRTPTVVTPRSEPQVPVRILRAAALRMDQAATRAGFGVLLETFGALGISDVVNDFFLDRKELHGDPSILMGFATAVPTGAFGQPWLQIRRHPDWLPR